MTTLLKKDYHYSSVLWEEVMQRVQEIIRDEYNISPYVAPTLNPKTPSPFRIWTQAQGTEILYGGAWHKEYTISVNHYLKTEDSERFYQKVYEESERLYQLFFNNQGTKSTQRLGFFGGEPEGIQITQEGDYFRIEVLFACQVFRADDVIYVVTAPSEIRARTRAIQSIYNFWSLDFDGTNDYIQIPTLTLSGDFTISLWVNVQWDNSWVALFGSSGSHALYLKNYTDMQWRINRAGAETDGDGNELNTIRITPFTATSGEWRNYTFVRSSGTCSIYENTVLKSNSLGGTFTETADFVIDTIGSPAGDDGYIKGQMSETVIFNSALSSSEIESIYNDGQPILLTENQGGYNSSGDLVAYYRMGSGSGDDRSTNGLIADQVDSSIGAELWNSTSADTWASTEGGSGENITITHSNGEYIFEGNGGDTFFITYLSNRDNVGSMGSLSSLLTANKIYKVVFTAKTENASGTNSVRVVGNETTTYSMTTTYTTYTTYMTADSSPSETDHYIQGYTLDDNEKIYIKDVSVKEIGGNPGKMVSFDSLDFRTNVPQIYDKALFSNSLVFDGTDDYIDISSIGDLTGKFTWSLWFKVSDESSNRRILGNVSSLNTLYITPSENIYAKIANGVLLTSNATVSTTAWNHLVYTRDGDNKCKFYLNGAEVGINNGTGSFVTGGIVRTGTLDINYIGKDSSDYASMTVSDVALFSTGLDATNVTAIYNSGKPIDLTCDAGNYNNANNMVGYWKMGDGYLDELPSASNQGVIYDQVTPIIDDDMVKNGDFSNSTSWSIGGGWAISGETLIGTSTVANANRTGLTIAEGKAYKLSFEITSYTSGSVDLGIGGTNGTLRSAIGSYEEYIIAGSGANLTVNGGTSFTGVVDNVKAQLVNGNPGLTNAMNASAQSISVPE